MLCHIVYPGAPGLTDSGVCCVALIPFYKGGMGAQRGDLLEPQSSLAQMRPAYRPLDVSHTHMMTDGGPGTQGPHLNSTSTGCSTLSPQPESAVGGQTFPRVRPSSPRPISTPQTWTAPSPVEQQEGSCPSNTCQVLLCLSPSPPRVSLPTWTWVCSWAGDWAGSRRTVARAARPGDCGSVGVSLGPCPGPAPLLRVSPPLPPRLSPPLAVQSPLTSAHPALELLRVCFHNLPSPKRRVPGFRLRAGQSQVTRKGWKQRAGPEQRPAGGAACKG